MSHNTPSAFDHNSTKISNYDHQSSCEIIRGLMYEPIDGTDEILSNHRCAASGRFANPRSCCIPKGIYLVASFAASNGHQLDPFHPMFQPLVPDLLRLLQYQDLLLVSSTNSEPRNRGELSHQVDGRMIAKNRSRSGKI